jgi:hypothetical protein
MKKLVVFCGIAGRRRAGMQHPPMAAYPLNHFTADELRELRRDPVFYLAIGDTATEETLDALEGALEQGGEAAQAAVEQSLVSDAHAAEGGEGDESGADAATGRQPKRGRKGA